MSNLLRIKVPVLFFLVIWAGCNTFDSGGIRDNSSDPESDNFVPSKPSSISFEVRKDQILINWEDISDFEDGYLVEKALNDTINFVQIAKLDSNNTSFIDSSKTISSKTYYKVSSFIESEDQTTKENSKIGLLKYNSINSFNIEYNGTEKAEISWSLNPHFSDGIIVERKLSNEKPFEQISVLNIDKNTMEENITDLKTFNIIYKISSFKYHEDSLLVNSSETKNIDVHYPKIESIQFNTENETVIRWKDLSSFESGFTIEKAARAGHEFTPYEKIADISPNKTIFTDNTILDSGVYYKYRISARFNTSVSKKTALVSDQFYIPKPNLMAIGTPGKMIKLSWNKPSEMVRGFIIERISNSEQFLELARVGEHTLTFEDESVNRSNSYTYRVKTLASDYSVPRSLKFNSGYQIVEEQILTQNENFEDPASPTIQLLNNNKIGIYSHHVDYEYNFNNSVFILDQNSLFTDIKLNTNNSYSSSYFNKDGQKLLQLGSSNNFNIDIYDTNSGNTIIQIPNAHQNETSIVTEGLAKFNYDATLIASAINHDSGLKIWEAKSGNLVEELEYDIFQIRNFEFHPSKNTLAVLHLSGLDVWDIASKEKLYSFTNSNEYNFKGAVTFSNSGDVLYYSSNKKLFVIDTNNGSILNSTEIPSTSHQIALNESINQIAIVFEQEYGQTVQIIDLTTFEIIQMFELATSDHPTFKFGEGGANAFSVHKINNNSMKVIKWANEENWYNTNKY